MITIDTVIVSLGVAAPIVTAVALGDRSESVLTTWKDWLDRNNGTVMAVIYLFFGVILIGKGIAGIELGTPPRVETIAGWFGCRPYEHSSPAP